ncbi:hypothetical protein CHU98_g2701 [Xylaria longipes]|nr:hypothetical protein CHU98_g2701 [Xylaria longipes]
MVSCSHGVCQTKPHPAPTGAELRLDSPDHAIGYRLIDLGLGLHYTKLDVMSLIRSTCQHVNVRARVNGDQVIKYYTEQAPTAGYNSVLIRSPICRDLGLNRHPSRQDNVLYNLSESLGEGIRLDCGEIPVSNTDYWSIASRPSVPSQRFSTKEQGGVAVAKSSLVVEGHRSIASLLRDAISGWHPVPQVTAKTNLASFS